MSYLNITRSAWSVVVSGAVVALGVCKKGKAGGSAGFGGGAPMGMPVDVAVARTDTVRDEIAATGQIEAGQSIDLRPEEDGRIVELEAREGRQAEQGPPTLTVYDAGPS